MNLLERATAIGIEGFLHCDELEKLADLACGKDVLEIGSFRGLSAWGMASVARSLWCVDTFSANSAGQQQMGHLTTLLDFERAIGRFKNVQYFIGTSAQAEKVGEPLLRSVQPFEQFDFIFLDAMHTYESVKEDIERWWPRVKTGGIMAFHDYGHSDFPGVKRAVDEKFGEAPDGTVIVTLRWITKT